MKKLRSRHRPILIINDKLSDLGFLVQKRLIVIIQQRCSYRYLSAEFLYGVLNYNIYTYPKKRFDFGSSIITKSSDSRQCNAIIASGELCKCFQRSKKDALLFHPADPRGIT